MDTQKRPLRLIIEGNIGAGKSTLLSILKNELDITIVPEPVDKWQNVMGSGNILDLFYKDTQRWAYTFQSYAFITRIQTILEHESKISSDNKYIQLLERSIYCDRFCFAKNCYESGQMSPLEWHIYTEWFSWLAQHVAPKPNGFIYLRTTPEIAYKRITKRQRSEENNVPLSYLTSLHDKLEDWLFYKKTQPDFLSTVPILTLDCNIDFEYDIQTQSAHLKKIKLFADILSKTQTAIEKPHFQAHL